MLAALAGERLEGVLEALAGERLEGVLEALAGSPASGSLKELVVWQADSPEEGVLGAEALVGLLSSIVPQHFPQLRLIETDVQLSD